MSLPTHGLDRDTVLTTLAAYKKRDVPWQGGQTFAYIYDPGAEAMAVGKEAFASFLTENALDPTVYPSLMRLENEIIGMAASHLNLGEGGCGSFTSGGTESILLAVKAARDFARAKRPEITRPKMVLPVTAHAAFHKAARYFDIELHLVEVDPQTFRAVPALMEAALDERTILAVVSTPSYAHGVIDPVTEIAPLCHARDIPCHVDACVGGWMLPFWRRLQQAEGVPEADQIPAFDFSVPGVTSLSMDLHKYGFCPKGASVVLFRDQAMRAAATFACSNWTGYTIINPSVQSTKSGGPLAGAWSVMRFLGDDGYLTLTGRLREATQALIAGIGAVEGIEIMGQPDMCMFAFTSTELDVFHVADEMKARGWYIQPQLGYTGPDGVRYPANVHLSLNNRDTKVEPFLKDFREAVQAARGLPDVRPGEELHGMLAEVAGQPMEGELLEGLLAVVGVGVTDEGAELPERMAAVNRLLDALPPKMNEALLTGFLGELYRPAR